MISTHIIINTLFFNILFKDKKIDNRNGFDYFFPSNLELLFKNMNDVV